jgi:hypothetical protein
MPRRPTPGDQWVVGRVIHNRFQRTLAVPLRVLHLRADGGRRLSHPSHRAWCQMPGGRPRHPSQLQVLVLVARLTAKRRHAAIVRRPPSDRRVMHHAVVPLQRRISCRVTVGAARMKHHARGLQEQSPRPLASVTHALECLRPPERRRRRVHHQRYRRRRRLRTPNPDASPQEHHCRTQSPHAPEREEQEGGKTGRRERRFLFLSASSAAPRHRGSGGQRRCGLTLRRCLGRAQALFM